MVSMFQLEVHL